VFGVNSNSLSVVGGTIHNELPDLSAVSVTWGFADSLLLGVSVVVLVVMHCLSQVFLVCIAGANTSSESHE